MAQSRSLQAAPAGQERQTLRNLLSVDMQAAQEAGMVAEQENSDLGSPMIPRFHPVLPAGIPVQGYDVWRSHTLRAIACVGLLVMVVFAALDRNEIVNRMKTLTPHFLRLPAVVPDMHLYPTVPPVATPPPVVMPTIAPIVPPQTIAPMVIPTIPPPPTMPPPPTIPPPPTSPLVGFTPSALHPGSNDDGRENRTRTTTTTALPVPVPGSGPIKEFYVYRAAANGTSDKYPFGNINVANLEGVMWYLLNEVVTKYSDGPRCPRKFDISEIRRYKVKVRATKELTEENMNMGIRFSYDFGNCMGRCFASNQCTSNGDCQYHYDKYGHFVGCNKFADHYPFPDVDTVAPNGIWFSFPLGGRCEHPTGAHNCTWSYVDAGMITLRSLEETALTQADWGWGSCCNNICSSFWEEQFSVWKMNWRVQQTFQLFQDKYPGMPRDLQPSSCDFRWWDWYSSDRWEKKDPWEQVRFKH